MATHDLQVHDESPLGSSNLSSNRKHALSLDPIGSSTSPEHGAISKTGKSKRSKNEDIDVNGITTEDVSMDLEEDKDSDASDSSDDFVDPSLKSNRTSSAAIAATVVTPILPPPPPNFAHNTSNFLPLASADDGEDRGAGAQLNAADYTHISQALAHQPLAINPSQQTIGLMQRLGAATAADGKSDEERLTDFMNEVKSQMFNLSQRIDFLETNRFGASASITNLTASVRSLENRLQISPSNSVHLDATTNPVDASTSSANPVSDAANVSSAESLGALLQSHITILNNGGASSALSNEIKAMLANPSLNVPTSISAVHASPEDTPNRGKKARRSLSMATPISDEKRRFEDTPGSDQKLGKKPRKPELSRAVRATMFRMLGLSLATNAPKYHGYTSSPQLPEFTKELSFDLNTGARVWRWEWDKTIRQSTYNGFFSMAIQNQVLQDRDAGMHKDVPAADWDSLEEAIDSAYTNLRRERDSQVDPMKKLKKDEHRKRGKKRGLKDEKSKRRTKACQENKVHRELSIPNATVPDGGSSWLNTLSSFSSSTDDLDAALDLRYMSSEDEVDTTDDLVLQTPVVDIVHGGTINLTPGEKTFSVHRPIWRSEKVQSAYIELDQLKPPERAYRRIIGEPRDEAPPPGTPDWMVSPDWKTGMANQLQTSLLKGKTREL